MRRALRRIVGRLAGTETARNEKAERDRARRQRKEDLRARRAELAAAKQQSEAERAVRKQEATARLDDERRALEAITAKAYDDYMMIRDHVRCMREWSRRSPVVLTDVEQRMVAALADLWNASPDTIATLRRRCGPMGGTCAGDYDAAASDFATRLKRELSTLRRQGPRDLFVQEPKALGGFGFEKRGELYNEDTLRFFKALVALHDGAVLQPCRDTTTDRHLVWEIGGGWGGFAHQLKTVCPNVTYVITGIPETFLVSAVYLNAVFPGARCRFVTEPSTDLWHHWDELDFIFAPESALPVLQPPRLDLTIDIMALRAMSVERTRFHVQRAFDLECPYLYSLMPPQSEAEQAGVWGVVERLYWPHPIPARREQWARPVIGVEPGPPPETEEAHLVGWRRIRV